jgi:hypothetical protein
VGILALQRGEDVKYTSTSSRKFLFDNISENDFETAPIAAINNPINELTII